MTIRNFFLKSLSSTVEYSFIILMTFSVGAMHQQTANQRNLVAELKQEASTAPVINNHIIHNDAHECSICAETITKKEINNNQVSIFQECDHVFHTDCIQDWHKRKKECPECRRPHTKVSVHKLEAFKRKTFNAAAVKSVTNCIACNQIFNNGEEITRLSCNQTHILHDRCLNKKIIQKGIKADCPVCKQVIGGPDQSIMQEVLQVAPAVSSTEDAAAMCITAGLNQQPAYHTYKPNTYKQQKISTILAQETACSFLYGLSAYGLYKTGVFEHPHKSVRNSGYGLLGATLCAFQKFLNDKSPSRINYPLTVLASWALGISAGILLPKLCISKATKSAPTL